MIRLVAAAVLLVLTGCTAAPDPQPGVTASPQPPSATPDLSAGADRSVCVDLDARGGAFYNIFVTPMMTGATGQKSVGVNVAQMSRAVAQVQGVGRGTLDQASPQIADEGRRMVAAAEAFEVYEHAEGTALLTAFVGLAVACQIAGRKPSWFDAESLTTG